jgi:hypothetical protein
MTVFHTPNPNLILTETSPAPPVRRITLRDELSFLASGIDEDGGVKNITIVPVCSVSYQSPDNTITDVSPIVGGVSNPSTAQQGAATLKQRVVGYSVKVSDVVRSVPAGVTIRSVRGNIYAEAENFYGGRARTPVFNFEFP